MMVHICEDQLGYDSCHDQIAFCWHSWAAPRWIESLDDFYPGDEYVDWVGISIFQQVYPWSTESSHFAGGTRKYIEEVADFAQQHHKPILIAESTPFGGIFGNGDTNTTFDIWSLWFAPVLSLIEEYDIRMWSYIDCDWDAQPMWHNIGFGDSRLTSSHNVMTKWREQVLQNPRFVMAPLECERIHESLIPTATLVPPTSMTDNLFFAIPKLFAMAMALALVLGLWLQRRRLYTLEHDDQQKDYKASDHTTFMDTRQDYGSLS